jgi:hypothetical protein
MLACAHGYVKFDEEQLTNLVHAFVQQSDAFVTREAARLRALAPDTRSTLDGARLALYEDATATLEKKMASLAEDNVNYQLWHSALEDALPLLAFRRAGLVACERGYTAGERLDRAALRTIAPLFATTGQYNYTIAIPQQLRTLQTMPEHIEALYCANFTLPGKYGETIWQDSQIE